MQKPFDISEKIFSDLKQKFKKLAESQSIKEFLTLNESDAETQELISFLKIYSKYDDLSSSKNDSNENLNSFDDTTIAVAEQSDKVEITAKENETSTDYGSEDYIKVENNEIKIDQTDHNDEVVVASVEAYNEEFIENACDESIDENFDDNKTSIEEQSNGGQFFDSNDHSFEENSADSNVDISQEKDFNEDLALKDLRYSKLDFEGEDEFNSDGENLNSEENTINNEENQPKENVFITAEQIEIASQKHQEEKKFRLSNIKGVKKMESLFENEMFGETKVLVEEDDEIEAIAKTNVSLDFMEAEKAKPLFKLDLNDRIAFTKKLFDGSQTDLNDAVSRLNDFETLGEAKEYLSEIYYEKGWAKEDEFAQRLWNLVESKFQ